MLGSHNSMSYLPPTNVWGKITRIWNKCQNKDLQGQYDAGARFFDVRVKLINNNWHYVHNDADFGYANISDLKHFFDNHIGCYIRIIYDLRSTPTDDEANVILTRFNNLIGYIKSDAIAGITAITYWNWNTTYINKIIKETEYHASVSANAFQYALGTEWFAKHYNKKALKKYADVRNSEEEVLLIDFV